MMTACNMVITCAASLEFVLARLPWQPNLTGLRRLNAGGRVRVMMKLLCARQKYKVLFRPCSLRGMKLLSYIIHATR